MIRPQQSSSRLVLNCDGLWDFKIDPCGEGDALCWHLGFAPDAFIAVPGSWNEQLSEIGLMNYVGAAWYQRKIFIPSAFLGQRLVLRIGSADFLSRVWINGHFLGGQEFGFLPQEYDITDYVDVGEEARITIWVSNALSDDTIPQGVSAEHYIAESRARDETFPPARFDFFPFGGIHRSVEIYATPHSYLADVSVQTKLLDDASALIAIRASVVASDVHLIKFLLSDGERSLEDYVALHDGVAQTEMRLAPCRFWSCETPFLYSLTVELIGGRTRIDDCRLPVGVREVRIENAQLLLNGKPVFLKGFGKHEDFPVLGKAFSMPLLVKDFALLKWLNANSFRTSHYPYAEEVLDLADKLGILVIDEVADISRDFRYTSQKSLAQHKAFLQKLVARDKNHPCVIAWSLSNEPNYLGEPEYHDGRGDAYWHELSKFVRTLDASRPITIANLQRATIHDPALKYCDFISINRYYGWYENPGQLDVASVRLSEELDTLYDKYKKPILISEFGADAVAGLHSTTDQLFTEEYQMNLLQVYCAVIASKPFVIGEHVWNFADFRTPQHHRRVVMNLKGVFTRTREPKRAAFFLKEHWSKGFARTGQNGSTTLVEQIIQ